MKLVLLLSAVVLVVSSATVLSNDIANGVSSKRFGIDPHDLTKEELILLLKADGHFAKYYGAYVGANDIIRTHRNTKYTRPKRSINFSGALAFLRRFTADGVTRSGSRVTHHFFRPGNYITALREFRGLNPSNVRRIGGSKFNGWTGTLDGNQVTVRSGSKGTNGINGPPTLSIARGDLINKFRFNPNHQNPQ